MAVLVLPSNAPDVGQHLFGKIEGFQEESSVRCTSPAAY